MRPGLGWPGSGGWGPGPPAHVGAAAKLRGSWVLGDCPGKQEEGARPGWGGPQGAPFVPPTQDLLALFPADGALEAPHSRSQPWPLSGTGGLFVGLSLELGFGPCWPRTCQAVLAWNRCGLPRPAQLASFQGEQRPGAGETALAEAGGLWLPESAPRCAQAGKGPVPACSRREAGA